MKGLRLSGFPDNAVPYFRIFTLWPEWRDYDRAAMRTDSLLHKLIFTLWPEWRDYDMITPLRLSNTYVLIFTLWPEWRDYDSTPEAIFASEFM